jgi:prepilin-type N-terminal cleavage/methylation domain-containing protein
MNCKLHTQNRGSRGFSLLETLVSVAILMILSLIVYQGFMTTLKLSSDTMNYQKSANAANGTANTALSSKVGELGMTGVASKIKIDPPVDITGMGDYLELDVNIYKATPPSPGIMDPANAAGVTSNRVVFRYIPPATPGT